MSTNGKTFSANTREGEREELNALFLRTVHATDEFKAVQEANKRKRRGQFFTPVGIARFMAGMLDFPEQANISILEPGAGTGLLSVCVILRALQYDSVQRISVTFVENDPDACEFLNTLIAEFEDVSRKYPLKIECEILKENFIAWGNASQYDIVICNPPYLKLPKNSEEAVAMAPFVYGQPNLYALFAIKAMQHLKPKGSFVFITPRSWTSGEYFRRMREYLLAETSLQALHLFESRDKVFSGETVLQETMIWAGVKNGDTGNVRISSSEDDSLQAVNAITVPFPEIVVNGKILLPVTGNDYDLLREMAGFSDTFDSLGYVFKTGPVVEFRNKGFLLENEEPGAIPLLRSVNVHNGEFTFPVHVGKAQYLKQDAKSSLLMPNNPTVIVKRLSAKEEIRRLQCCEYIPLDEKDRVSMENHVNYLARKDGKPLSLNEVNWAFGILSSDVYDRYFRIVNGNTQVNAGELNSLPVKRRGFG